MFEHVETIVADDALEFACRPGLGRRDAQIDGDALEGLAVLPACGRIGDQPAADRGIVDIERAGLLRSAGLRPVDPETKLEAMPVGIVRDTGEPVREFFWIRPPVAHV